VTGVPIKFKVYMIRNGRNCNFISTDKPRIAMRING